MEISGIRGSFGNLFQYINERDRNNDGVIGNGEVSSEEFDRLDINHNGQIQNSEIMVAANLTSPAWRFSTRNLSQVREGERRGTPTRIRIVNSETIYGGQFNRGSIIIYNNAREINILPSTNTVINGVAFRAGTLVTFYANGHVLGGTLAADTTINGISFRAGTEVAFNENGHVGGATLTADTTINGISFGAGTSVTFYVNGRVGDGILAADSTINGISFRADTRVEFYANGRVRRGTLAADNIISERLFRAGTEVNFDENGQVTNR
jgi:hemin uptake protein HemP